jgi:hypothetical protein
MRSWLRTSRPRVGLGDRTEDERCHEEDETQGRHERSSIPERVIRRVTRKYQSPSLRPGDAPTAMSDL